MKKWLLIGIAVLIIVVGGAVFFLVSSLDSLIVAGVEKYGSEITKAKVSLKEAKVSITSGEGALRGLSVGNTSGFKTEFALRLGEVSVNLDTATVTQNPIVIKKVLVASPEVIYELGKGGSNIDAIQRNVNAYMAKWKSAPAPQKKAAAGDETKLIIENLYIRGGKVNVSAGFLQGKALGASLPDIHIKNIGKKNGGASPGEIVQEVITAIRQQTTKAIIPLGLDKLAGAAAAGVKGAAELIEKGAKGTLGAAEEGAKSAGDALKGILGGIGGK
jgi:hypothetical protein